MMTPSVAPMILIYARIGRQTDGEGRPLAASTWFALGYLLSWTAFSIAATTVQWALERAALLTPMMESASNALGATVLIVAGLYQWTSFKDACLSYCQTPLGFILRYGFRREATGALALGLRHGLYCIGCCWAVMTLLFVAGVMNLFWIAAFSALVLVEKVMPLGRLVPRLAGIACIVAGAWLLTQPRFTSADVGREENPASGNQSVVTKPLLYQP
jgi:predicted metal-binding membrane protein